MGANRSKCSASQWGLRVAMAALLTFGSMVGYDPSASAAGDTVTISDASFAQCIAWNLHLPAETTTFDSTTLANLASLSCSYNSGYDGSLRSLEGIQAMTGLVALDADQNSITSLAPLSGLVGLKSLSIGDNPVTTLDPLASITSLTSLSVGGTFTDLSPIEHLTNLTSLNLAGEFPDLGPIRNLSGLQSLGLGSPRLESLAPLSGLFGLTRLGLEGSRISDLGPLGPLTQLTSLNISNSGAIQIGALESLTALRELTLENDQIGDVTALANLTNLESLDLTNNRIQSLAPLGGLFRLTSLIASNNPLSNLSALAALTNLEYLNLDHTGLSDVTEVASFPRGAPRLDSVWIQGNNVSDITAFPDWVVVTAWGQSLSMSVTVGEAKTMPMKSTGTFWDFTNASPGLSVVDNSVVASAPGVYTVDFEQESSDRYGGTLTVTATAPAGPAPTPGAEPTPSESTAPAPDPPALASLIATGKPSISGTAKAGTTLKARIPKGKAAIRWSQTGVKVSHQWLVGGQVRSTKTKYRVQAKDAGLPVTFALVANKSGYATGYAASSPKTVAKLATKTNLASRTLTAGVAGWARINVRTNKLSAIGTVNVLANGKVVATTTLTAASKGKATLNLPAFARGTVTLRAVYTGSTQTKASTSKTLRIKVR